MNPLRQIQSCQTSVALAVICQLACGLDTVVRRHPRANHRHGVLVLRCQIFPHVKHDGRIVNLAEQRGIMFIG